MVGRSFVVRASSKPMKKVKEMECQMPTQKSSRLQPRMTGALVRWWILCMYVPTVGVFLFVVAPLFFFPTLFPLPSRFGWIEILCGAGERIGI